MLSFNTGSPDKREWRDLRDEISRTHLFPMTLEKGVKELYKTQRWINHALSVRLVNIRTGEIIPGEILE